MDYSDEINSIQNELDNRICTHVARGNKVAYDIVRTYHMSEIAQIRSYMLDVLPSDSLCDARQLNYAFNMAVIELGVNLELLLKENTQVIGNNEQNVKLAM